jgi:D-alanyl-D-alanine endopeptidase (penicillin-binding protein 7)
VTHRGRSAIAVVLALVTLLATFGESTAFSLNAREAGVYDLESGEWLYSKSIDTPVHIASITKVAAALTFVRLSSDLDQIVTITREDWVRAGRTPLRVGDRVPVGTLLRLALVASDNCAARSLAHALGLSRETFGYHMTETAWSLGCRRAQFVDPTGLDTRNVASARDVVLLFRAALENPTLREIMGTRQFVLRTRRGPRTIVHSSRLLRYRREVAAAKTGYLAAAGYCMVQYVDDGGRGFITVVLGTPSKRARTRESARLIDYTKRTR